MTPPLGKKLQIRTMIYVAGEPIPYFWPMRSFIHHNPLHGLEYLPFQDAVEEGGRLFHANRFLKRVDYQRYLHQGKVDEAELAENVTSFVANREPLPQLDLHRWLMTLLTEMKRPVVLPDMTADVSDIRSVLTGSQPTPFEPDAEDLAEGLRRDLLDSRPVYEAVDALYGTEIGSELDELVIKSCLDFFDEGQSVWAMPGRSQGFFDAWRSVASRNGRLYLRGLHINRIIGDDDTPEDVIAHVMHTLGVPDHQWMNYFTRELARLHGWAGFIRWRSNARNYYWSERFPADLVDYLAIRLTLALALLNERKRRKIAVTAVDIANAIEQRPHETYLRHELNSGRVLPAMAARVEQTLAKGRPDRIKRLCTEYVTEKRAYQARCQVQRLGALARKAQQTDALHALPGDALGELLHVLGEFERTEGMIWLRAMEKHAMRRLLDGLNTEPSAPRERRPFAQAMFCIDTRSERIRRHLENVGDYQTYGIAGFFGVPVSFMELGKGSETYLCPVLLTPKNLVLELAVTGDKDVAAVTVLDKVMHELKESVLSPFVTVEAVGMLFGLDMVGKTIIPKQYNRWRKRLYKSKPSTHLMLDKLSREQADAVVRAVQRVVIAKTVEQEFRLSAESISDSLVGELREAAMGNRQDAPTFTQTVGLDRKAEQAFIERLRRVYRIDPFFARLQLERLGRLGFSLDEQVGFVSQALSAIGLTEGFSRFILLVGHGSTSENNPYESALDCGACGGNQGLVNARALAQMANKPGVRRRLRKQGIEIPEDAWFVPALHDTTTDELQLFDLDRIPASHVLHMDRLRKGLIAASRLCTQERMPELQIDSAPSDDPEDAFKDAQRNAMDWSQVRPEWGLATNAYFVIGRRSLTQSTSLQGRAFLHSYDYRLDPKQWLLENILTGPLVVAQWINMEHYFSTVDNERFGSGSKAYHNVAGRFGVMTGNLSDLRTGLPSQTVLEKGLPYHEPLRLITVIEAPFEHACRAVENVATVKYLVRNDWIRLMIIDPETSMVSLYEEGRWSRDQLSGGSELISVEETTAS